MTTCPHCRKELSVTEAPKQTDEEFFLAWWTPTIGAEEAKRSWEDKQKNVRMVAPMVQSDISGYQSQIDGSWIDSRSKHRSHLKQHNMIEMGNDVPMKQKELSARQNRERKEFIGRQVYEKLR